MVNLNFILFGETMYRLCYCLSAHLLKVHLKFLFLGDCFSQFYTLDARYLCVLSRTQTLKNFTSEKFLEAVGDRNLMENLYLVTCARTFSTESDFSET